VSANVDHLHWAERVFLLPVLRMHHRIYLVTRGRLGHRLLPGLPPCLLLHTTGARTGKARATTLVYAPDGRDYLVVASFGGSPKAPAWLHNVRCNPHAEINVGANRMRVVARVVLPDDGDYARIWGVVNLNSSDEFERLQQRTSRPIAVVVLSPS